ncbi:LysR family transcriptional regulator [Vibrio coralliilyticus]|uniref:LysR family transcriptional regulator n=1 Tax=Vibrio coralliilyticus TaxID=190893 RepID=UPI0020A408CB|nr:LysR family transcriptional regulator [Vibrio coralliilyticus]
MSVPSASLCSAMYSGNSVIPKPFIAILISRKITRLESQLGVRLLERSTRTLHLTEIGQRYYQYCKRIKEEYEAAGSAVESMLEKPQGRLRVCTSLGVGQSLLGDHLAEYCRHYPDVELDLSLTNRRVDLIEEGYDLAFRVGDLPDSGLIAKKLCSINLRLYAAPSLAKHRINTPSDLLKLMRMAIKGLGITELPEYMAEHKLAEGTLINILPDWQFEPVDLYALYPSHRGSTPKVRALLTYLSQALPR